MSMTPNEMLKVAKDPRWKVSGESLLLAELMRKTLIENFQSVKDSSIIIQRLKNMTLDEVARYSYLFVAHYEKGEKIPCPI